MRLDHLAHPFRIQQIGEALRRVLRLHQVGVVAERGHQTREVANRPVGIAVLGGIVLRDLLGHVRGEPAVALPDDEMRGVGGVDDVDGMDAAPVFLANALEHALGAGALDAHRDAGILRLEARLATRSDTGRSIAVYQTTLPSFCAAAISAGVTARRLRRRRAHIVRRRSSPPVAAADALSTSRRVNGASAYGSSRPDAMPTSHLEDLARSAS